MLPRPRPAGHVDPRLGLDPVELGLDQPVDQRPVQAVNRLDHRHLGFAGLEIEQLETAADEALDRAGVAPVPALAGVSRCRHRPRTLIYAVTPQPRPTLGLLFRAVNQVAASGVEHRMTGTIESTTGRRAAPAAPSPLRRCALALIGVVAVSSAGAKPAKVLGKTKHTPPPDCPKDTAQRPCEGIGSVTGFPLVADGEKRPMKVHRDGKLVAWAIDLSRPKKSQRNFFSSLFKSSRYGKTPTARIAVIKHKGRTKYKLLRQSPVVKLSGALGRKELFTLDRPLRVRKGQIVALTVPTWASNFASHIAEHGNRWRGSRSSKNCSPKSSDIAESGHLRARAGPSRRSARLRGYGCDYTAARLLYWAYYVRRLIGPLVAGAGAASRRRAQAAGPLPGGAGRRGGRCPRRSSLNLRRRPCRPCHRPRRRSRWSWCSWSWWWTTSSWSSSEWCWCCASWSKGWWWSAAWDGHRGVVSAAAPGQRQAHRQRQGGERAMPGSRRSVEGGLAQAAIGAVADVEADQLVAAPADPSGSPGSAEARNRTGASGSVRVTGRISSPVSRST